MSERPVKTIHSAYGVTQLLTADGVLSCPIMLVDEFQLNLSNVPAVSLAGMHVGAFTTVILPISLKTLDGVHCDRRAVLRQCDNLQTLGNAVLGTGVRLENLHRLESLGTATFGNAVELNGMPDGIDFGTPELTDDELRIVQQIKLDMVELSMWHSDSPGCGTAHCLAGWAEAIHCRDNDLPIGKSGESAYRIGCDLLPHLSHLFFAVKCKQSVREMLVRLQAIAAKRLKQ